MSLIDRIRNKITGILSPHFLGREQIALVEMSGAVLEEAQEQTNESIAGVQAQIDVLRSEEGAGLIGIEDTGGYFTAVNVEGALEELAANIGNFDPATDYTITGEWDFAQPVSFLNGAFGVTLVPEVLTDDRMHTLQDASGTLAFLSDIPAPTPEVLINAGTNVSVAGSFPSYTISVPNIPAQVNLIAGSNVNITGTYPNLTISATGGGGGGGDVTSVNGQIGDVVLDAADVGAAADNEVVKTSGNQTGLAGNKTWTGTHRFSAASGIADIYLTSADVDVGGVFAEDGRTVVWTSDGGYVALRPSGRGSVSGEFQVTQSGITWANNTVYHSGNTHVHSASDITSGVLSTARLGSGTANSSRFLRGDGTWAAVPAGANGTVTSVNISAGTGISATGGPITTSGTISLALSTNLQSWSGISPSSKANDNAVVKTSGNQTGISGNKTFTGTITASNLTATSDTRLKYDIARKEPRQELLEFIKLYGWKWIHNKEEGLGVLAQDVKKIAPEYVHEAEDGMLSVDKAGLAIEMVMAMMEKIDGSSN